MSGMGLRPFQEAYTALALMAPLAVDRTVLVGLMVYHVIVETKSR